MFSFRRRSSDQGDVQATEEVQRTIGNTVKDGVIYDEAGDRVEEQSR